MLEVLDIVEAHGFSDRMELILRDVALLMPDECFDLARKLYVPVSPRRSSWPDPALDDKRDRLEASCRDDVVPDAQALRARIPLARDALAQMYAGPAVPG
jgi:hypothetical protein